MPEFIIERPSPGRGISGDVNLERDGRVARAIAVLPQPRRERIGGLARFRTPEETQGDCGTRNDRTLGLRLVVAPARK